MLNELDLQGCGGVTKVQITMFHHRFREGQKRKECCCELKVETSKKGNTHAHSTCIQFSNAIASQAHCAAKQMTGHFVRTRVEKSDGGMLQFEHEKMEDCSLFM